MNTNPNVRVVVCYGDSNTWGDVPNKDERHSPNVRWVGVLQNALGDEYEVVNEGLCGRTFEVVEADKEHRSGITHLKSMLQTNKPTNFITIMLGTNDMKSTFGLTADDIASHLRNTVQFIQREKTGVNGTSPSILVICPPPVVNPDSSELDERMKEAPKTSLLLAPLYKKVAKNLGCLYLNAGDFIDLKNTDGYHLAKEHHKALGEKVAVQILQASS